MNPKSILKILERDVHSRSCWQWGGQCLDYDCPYKEERCMRERGKKWMIL